MYKRGWDGLMVYWLDEPTQWTGVWASSESCWQMGKPGMLQSMGSQRDGHDWATELNWGLVYWRNQTILYTDEIKGGLNMCP